MKKFEYEVKEANNYEFKKDSFEEAKYLKKQGEQGWELVSVVSIAMGNAALYYFKREIVI